MLSVEAMVAKQKVQIKALIAENEPLKKFKKGNPPNIKKNF